MGSRQIGIEGVYRRSGQKTVFFRCATRLRALRPRMGKVRSPLIRRLFETIRSIWFETDANGHSNVYQVCNILE